MSADILEELGRAKRNESIQTHLDFSRAQICSQMRTGRLHSVVFRRGRRKQRSWGGQSEEEEFVGLVERVRRRVAVKEKGMASVREKARERSDRDEFHRE